MYLTNSKISTIAVIKVIPIEKISQEPRFLDLLKREIDIMTKIEHPNIVKMYGASRTARNLYMFLEYCKDGDLKVIFYLIYINRLCLKKMVEDFLKLRLSFI